MREKHNLPPEVTLHIRSEGPIPITIFFALLSQIDSKVEVNWYFIKRHHGKGPIDGMGGTIKNKVYRDVMSNKCLIKNAKDFLEYVNKNINDITSIYMPINELLTEPDNIENAPKIPETLSFHKVTRSSMKIIFVLLNCFVWLITMIHFLHSSTGKMTTQRFCGHENLPLLFHIDQTFAFCKAKYVSSKEMMMMMMMNCCCGMVDRRKVFSLISSRDHCQRSSPSRISDTP